MRRHRAPARTSMGLALALVISLLQARCTGLLSLDDRSCPCTDGYVCCESSRRCLRPGTPCDTADAGDAAVGPCGVDRAPCGGGCCIAVKSITAGEGHTCVITRAGGVKCWGNGRDGQLGNGTRESSFAPVDVKTLDHGIAAVVGGSGNTYAISDTQELYAWGSNQLGGLGIGKSADATVPVRPKTTGEIRSVASGGAHTCAVNSDGVVSCWGSNNYGELGIGRASADFFETTPQQVVGLTIRPERAFVGGAASCATDFMGRLHCWGALFDGSNPMFVPAPIFGLRDVDAMALSRSNHACIVQGGVVRCWGDNTFGAVGAGAPAGPVPSPVAVPGVPGDVRAVGVGLTYSCALTGSGGVLCWGSNHQGTLGNGLLEESATPVQVAGLTTGVAALAVGNDHACVVMETGAVMCWGNNVYGQLSIPDATASRIPTVVTNLR